MDVGSWIMLISGVVLGLISAVEIYALHRFRKEQATLISNIRSDAKEGALDTLRDPETRAELIGVIGPEIRGTVVSSMADPEFRGQVKTSVLDLLKDEDFCKATMMQTVEAAKKYMKSYFDGQLGPEAKGNKEAAEALRSDLVDHTPLGRVLEYFPRTRELVEKDPRALLYTVNQMVKAGPQVIELVQKLGTPRVPPAEGLPAVTEPNIPVYEPAMLPPPNGYR